MAAIKSRLPVPAKRHSEAGGLRGWLLNVFAAQCGLYRETENLKETPLF